MARALEAPETRARLLDQVREGVPVGDALASLALWPDTKPGRTAARQALYNERHRDADFDAQCIAAIEDGRGTRGTRTLAAQVLRVAVEPGASQPAGPREVVDGELVEGDGRERGRGKVLPVIDEAEYMGILSTHARDVTSECHGLALSLLGRLFIDPRAKSEATRRIRQAELEGTGPSRVLVLRIPAPEPREPEGGA